MKKKILGLILATFGFMGIAEARVYFGIEGGYADQTLYSTGLKAYNVYFSSPSTQTISDALKNNTKGYSVAGVVGSENLFANGFMGTRTGLSAGYTSFQGDLKVDFLDVGLSSDLILNLVVVKKFSLGLFGGIETDYHYALNIVSSEGMSRHLLDFAGRVGVTTLIADHHRLEVMAKLPVASLNFASDHALLGGVAGLARTSFLASYKFAF